MIWKNYNKSVIINEKVNKNNYKKWDYNKIQWVKKVCVHYLKKFEINMDMNRNK